MADGFVRTVVGGRALRSVAAAALVASCAHASAQAQVLSVPAGMVRACPNSQASPDRTSMPALGRATVCLVNRIRVANGLRRLRVRNDLSRFALAHARLMVARKFFGHDIPGGRTFARRARASPYAKAARRMSMGENLVWGGSDKSSPVAVVRSWMASPTHRANILRRDFRDIGVGVTLGAPDRGQWGRWAVTYSHTFGWRVLR